MRNKAILYAMVAVLSWSTVATAFKKALTYLTPYEMLLVACATATVIFALAVTVRRKWGLVRQLKASDWAMAALMGMLNPVAYYLVLFKSYDLLPAHVAQPVNYTWPILLVVMLAVFNRQRIPAGKYLGMAVSLAGVTLISSGSGDDAEVLSVKGLVLGFISALLWATYWMANNRNRKEIDSKVSLLLSFFFGTVYLLAGAPFVGVNLTSVPGVLAGTYVGAFEMGIPFIFFSMALRTSPNTALVNQLSYLAPFLSLFIIAMVLGETITWVTVGGLVLIVLGIVWNEFVISPRTSESKQSHQS